MNLSPEIIKMREALLERIGDKSLKEVAQIVNEILLNETDSTNRLAALAARVKVLRNYINKNYDIKNKSKKSELNNAEKSFTYCGKLANALAAAIGLLSLKFIKLTADNV